MSGDILPVTPADLAASPRLGEALLALNNAHAMELSLLDPDRLRHLVAQAFLARRVGEADAFLVAFDQDADYDSPNFLWFRRHARRFVYVDRVVVAAQARGRGLARRLYLDLFARAAEAGHDRVVCEVNANPPNPASDAFHAALGFNQIGTGTIHGGAKTVTYLERALTVGREEGARMLAGGCYCGAVRYAVHDAFLYAGNCHCSNCRRTTGSAFKPYAGIERDKLRVTQGGDNLLLVGDDTGNDTHCGTCGSLLYSVVRDGAFVHVAMGTLADAPSIRPDKHIFVGSKAPWFTITDDLPQYEGHVAGG